MLRLAGSDLPDRKGPRGRSKEPKPTAQAPNPPTWLCEEARAEWRRIVPQLDRLGVLAVIDRAALTAYVETWAMYVDLARQCQTAPKTVIGGDGGEKKNPLFTILNETRAAMRQLIAEFGMTPATRSRVVVPEDAKKPVDDPLAAMLAGRRTG